MGFSEAVVAQAFEKAFLALPSDMQSHVRWWCDTAVCIKGGDDVVRNTKEDMQVPHDVFISFLKLLVSNIERSAVRRSALDQRCVKKCYDEACIVRSFHFKGNRSRLDDNVIFHVILRKVDLDEMIKDAMGAVSVVDDDLDAWESFWDMRISDDDRLEILSEFLLFDDRKYIVWAYLDQNNPDLVDPLEGTIATECCRMLGLPEEWYPKGTWFYKLHYVFEEDTKKQVPTFLDAGAKGWNPYFRPTDEPLSTARWGWTRPLGTSREDRGVPEVIHPARITATCPKLPDDLGTR